MSYCALKVSTPSVDSFPMAFNVGDTLLLDAKTGSTLSFCEQIHFCCWNFEIFFVVATEIHFVIFHIFKKVGMIYLSQCNLPVPVLIESLESARVCCWNSSLWKLYITSQRKQPWLKWRLSYFKKWNEDSYHYVFNRFSRFVFTILRLFLVDIKKL